MPCACIVTFLKDYDKDDVVERLEGITVLDK